MARGAGADVGLGDRVVAAEHDRDRPGVDDLADERFDRRVRAQRVGGDHRGVAVVDHPQHLASARSRRRGGARRSRRRRRRGSPAARTGCPGWSVASSSIGAPTIATSAPARSGGGPRCRGRRRRRAGRRSRAGRRRPSARSDRSSSPAHPRRSDARSQAAKPRDAASTLAAMAGDEMKIPKGRVRRSAKLGTALGGQAARYAGTRAAVGRALGGRRRGEARGPPPRDGAEDGPHARRDEGRGDEDRPARLVHRHRVPAARVRRDLPGGAGEAAHLGAADAVGAGLEGDRGGVRRARARALRRVRARRRSPPPRSARCTARRCSTGARSRSRSSTRASPRRSSRTCATPACSSASRGRWRRGSTRRRSPRSCKLRVLEELDYEYEAQNQRTFSRAYRGHPFIYVPDVITRLSRRRVLVTEFVDGHRVRGGQGARRRAAQPLRRDRLPLLLRLDLPPAALQRRLPPRQLPADGRRAGRLPRLRDDEEARPRADRARAGGARRRDPQGPRGAAPAPPRPRLHQEADQARRRAADGPRDAGRRLVHRGPRVPGLRAAGDEDHRVGLGPALGVLLDHAPREHPRRGADGPADGDRRDRRPRAAQGEAQLAPDHARVGLRRRARRPSSAVRSGSTSSRAGSGGSRGWRHPDAPDRDHQPDQGDRRDHAQAELDPGRRTSP